MMNKILHSILFFFIFCTAVDTVAQDIAIGEPDMLMVRKRQWNIYGTLHTNGIGICFNYDQIKSIKLQHGLDIEWTFYRHFKEQRVEVAEGSYLVYGKKNYFGQLRGGYGVTRILNTKHYSGGVEVGYYFYGGASVGFSVPVFLEIYYIDPQLGLISVTEEYDPEKHSTGNIKCKAPIYKGFSKIKIHPGAYIKTGLSFDFSTNDALVVKLDAGIAADIYAIPVEKMANTKQYFLLTGYLTIHLGKRLSIYE